MSTLVEKYGRSYSKDSIIFFEYEPGDALFVIHSGEVRIAKIIGGVEKTLAILRAGDIFGEMSLLEGKPRTATAIAETDVVVMAFDQTNFENLIEKQPQFACRLAEMLSKRIVESHRHLDNLEMDSSKARLVDVLLWKAVAVSNSIYVPMTPKEVAEYAGFSENDFYDILADLLKVKKIVIHGDRIELPDRAGLERIIKSSKK